MLWSSSSPLQGAQGTRSCDQGLWYLILSKGLFNGLRWAQGRRTTGTCTGASSLAKWIWIQSRCAMVWTRGCTNESCDTDEQRKPQQQRPSSSSPQMRCTGRIRAEDRRK